MAFLRGLTADPIPLGGDAAAAALPSAARER
jgi:hypothetical protein